jgi:hypothetical protein
VAAELSDLAQPVYRSRLKLRWLAALDAAEHFFTTRDPSEVGCLYYSRSLGKFIEPRPGEDVVPHYGRPGGVLPTVRQPTRWSSQPCIGAC